MVWKEALSTIPRKNKKYQQNKVAECEMKDMPGQSRHAAAQKPVWALLGIKSSLRKDKTSTFSKQFTGQAEVAHFYRGDIPMVEMYVELKLSSAKRIIRQVLPTPLSPISNSL